jgi:hypothetical protein
LLLGQPPAAMTPGEDVAPLDLLGLGILFVTLVAPIVAVTLRMVRKRRTRAIKRCTSASSPRGRALWRRRCRASAGTHASSW